MSLPSTLHRPLTTIWLARTLRTQRIRRPRVPSCYCSMQAMLAPLSVSLREGTGAVGTGTAHARWALRHWQERACCSRPLLGALRQKHGCYFYFAGWARCSMPLSTTSWVHGRGAIPQLVHALAVISVHPNWTSALRNVQKLESRSLTMLKLDFSISYHCFRNFTWSKCTYWNGCFHYQTLSVKGLVAALKIFLVLF